VAAAAALDSGIIELERIVGCVRCVRCIGGNKRSVKDISSLHLLLLMLPPLVTPPAAFSTQKQKQLN